MAQKYTDPIALGLMGLGEGVKSGFEMYYKAKDWQERLAEKRQRAVERQEEKGWRIETRNREDVQKAAELSEKRETRAREEAWKAAELSEKRETRAREEAWKAAELSEKRAAQGVAGEREMGIWSPDSGNTKADVDKYWKDRVRMGTHLPAARTDPLAAGRKEQAAILERAVVAAAAKGRDYPLTPEKHDFLQSYLVDLDPTYVKQSYPPPQDRSWAITKAMRRAGGTIRDMLGGQSEELPGASGYTWKGIK